MFLDLQTFLFFISRLKVLYLEINIVLKEKRDMCTYKDSEKR